MSQQDVKDPKPSRERPLFGCYTYHLSELDPKLLEELFAYVEAEERRYFMSLDESERSED